MSGGVPAASAGIKAEQVFGEIWWITKDLGSKHFLLDVMETGDRDPCPQGSLWLWFFRSTSQILVISDIV